MQESVAVVEQARVLLEELATTRGRLAMSAAVVLLALLVGTFVVPVMLNQVRRVVAKRFLNGPAAESVELFGEYIPTTLTELVVRALQVGVLVTTALSLLVVWGQVETAIAIGSALVLVSPKLLNLGFTVLLALLAVIGSDQIKRAVPRLSEGADRITEHQEEIMIRVGQLTLFVAVGASVLTLWGINLSGLLVGAGFLGIVVGFAARQTLGSLIAGFVLMFSRPFTIGDWVQIDDDEGIVTDITIFNPRLENFDGEFIVIPNDTVGDSPVTNRSRKGLLRLRSDVGIDYGSDPDRAMEVARDAMEELDEVAPTPPPQVVPKEFGDSAVVLELRYWIDHPTPPRRWAAVSAVVRQVKSAFDDAGITIPYPQRELSARAGTRIDTGGPNSFADGPAGGENGEGHASTVPDPED